MLQIFCDSHLCNQLHNATSLCNLALSLFGEEPRLDDEWNLGNATLAQDLAVAKRQQV